MPYRYLMALLASLLLVSCGNDDPVVLPPVNEFLVVGNDRGFRDDFINQANLITVHDSSIVVRSLRSVDNPRTYPIIDGYVHGGNDPVLHWAMDTIGQDTISFRDTSRNSTFYLHRLNRVDSLPGTLSFLTSGEIKNPHRESFRFFRSHYVFNDGGQGAGCLITRSYLGVRDWASLAKSEKVDTIPPVSYFTRRETERTLWRYYDQFAQPVLVQDNAENGMTVMLLDSLSTSPDTLYARSVTDRSFTAMPRVQLVKDERIELSHDDLMGLEQSFIAAGLLDSTMQKNYTRRWYEGDLPENHLTITPEEVDKLQLRFADDAMHLEINGASIASTAYRFHESAPYLLAGDECTSDDYWHVQLRGDTVTFSIPLRVDLPVTGEPRTFLANGRTITLPPSRHYLPEEWRATYLLEKGK